VRAEDGAGTLVSGFSGPISVTLGANPGGAALGGTTTVNAVNGVATFGTLTVSAAGAGYRLVASSGALTTATSTPFTIAAPPPPPLCSPRPNVRVTTAVLAPGQLQATIVAQTSAGTPANGLSSIRLTRVENAVIQLNGSPIGADQTILLPAGTSQATLLLDRRAPTLNPSLASTVSFAVTDACGEWKSFVGGGPGAF
jgi:hypothetical protein